MSNTTSNIALSRPCVTCAHTTAFPHIKIISHSLDSAYLRSARSRRLLRIMMNRPCGDARFLRFSGLAQKIAVLLNQSRALVYRSSGRDKNNEISVQSSLSYLRTFTTSVSTPRTRDCPFWLMSPGKENHRGARECSLSLSLS
jgi:hypothetical protein